MCYNTTISYAFFVVGITVCLYIYNYSNALRSTYIHYVLFFYALMELLQGTQYFYVNDCSSNVNRGLTNVAYILVILQPLLWNWFFYINSERQDAQVFMTGIVLAIVWMMINVFGRLMYDKDYNYQTKNMSIFATDSTCTKKRKTHLYWEWTSANFKDLTANFLMYVMIWFIPALVVRKFRNIALLLIASASVAALSAYLNGEHFTFTSLWCYVSVPIVIGVLVLVNGSIRGDVRKLIL